MSEEIDAIISRILELYRRDRVTGDTREATEIRDVLIAFAVRYDIEGTLRPMLDAHLPTRSNQKMSVEDANALIKCLMSLRPQIQDEFAAIKDIMHPVVFQIVEPRMVAGQYADAVESALKEINNRVKEIILAETGEEKDGTPLMQYAFGSTPPHILLVPNLDTETNRDIQRGYQFLFAGAMSAIRNPKAHANLSITKGEALRHLMFASTLMYKLDAITNAEMH